MNFSSLCTFSFRISFSKKGIGLFTSITHFPTLICTLLDTCLDSLFDLGLWITCTWSLLCTKSRNDELKEKSGEDQSINDPMLIVRGERNVPMYATYAFTCREYCW